MSTQADDPKQQAENDSLTALYRKVSGGQPSARHDALVLAAARVDLATTAKAKPARSRQWRLPFALAATVMLAVVLTLTVDREQLREGDVALPALPAAQPIPAAQAPAAAPAASRESNLPAAPAPRPEPVRPAAKPAFDSPQATPQPFPPESAGTRESPAAPAAAPPVPIRDAAGDAASRAAPTTGNAASPATAPKTAMPPAAAGTAGPAPSNLVPRSRPDESAGAAAQREAAQPAKTLPTPQEWVAEIRALRQAGNETEAQAALARLKLAYPDFPLPDDLAAKRLP